MKGFAFRRPSLAMAVAGIALFLALAGTGYAAFSLPANSVGSKQLKSGAPGYLCLYTFGTTGTVFYSDDGTIFPSSGGKLGVVLYWTVGAGDAYVGGEWTVTAS